MHSKEYSVGILPSFRLQTLKKAPTNADSIGVSLLGQELEVISCRQTPGQVSRAFGEKVNRLKVVDPPVRELISARLLHSFSEKNICKLDEAMFLRK